MSVSVWSRFNETQVMHEAARTVLPLKRSWSPEKLYLAGRVYLTMLIDELDGRGTAAAFVKELYASRYQRVVSQFPTTFASPISFCKTDLPMTDEEFLKENMELFSNSIQHQANLFKQNTNQARRNIWLGNFCEQLAMTVAGVANAAKFLEDFWKC
jgi:predicted enzyme involved in methoxymalonyl-ACP biosynthesis